MTPLEQAQLFIEISKKIPMLSNEQKMKLLRALIDTLQQEEREKKRKRTLHKL
jgi:hypothetical protein